MVGKTQTHSQKQMYWISLHSKVNLTDRVKDVREEEAHLRRRWVFRPLKEQTVAQCSAHLKASQCLHHVFMGAAFTEHVTDGISNQWQILFSTVKGGHFGIFNIYLKAHSARWWYFDVWVCTSSPSQNGCCTGSPAATWRPGKNCIIES